MLAGKGVSAGCGIGRAMIIREQPLEYTPRSGCEPEEEKRRLEEAVEGFCERARRIAQRLKGTAGEREAEIPLGHIAMISDPYMQGEIDSRIEGGVCAEAALEEVCDMFIGVFSSADDELTRQRADDVRNIKNAVLALLLGYEPRDIAAAPPDTVLVCTELTPSMAAGIVRENIVGIVAERGGETSHSAILARAMEIPAVLGVKDATSLAEEGVRMIVDGTAGEVLVDPSAPQIDSYTKLRAKYIEEKKALNRFMGKLTRTKDGRRIELFCNIGEPEEAVRALACDGEGIGLFRTEFLFMDRGFAPGEEEQFEAYKRAAIVMKNRPVIIRTLDAGGDKDVPCLKLKREDNPFLGFRAIRYCLKNEKLFLTQLRALLRAGVYGDIGVMLPFISSLEEVEMTRALLERAKEQLKAEGTLFDDKLRLGVMIETPAAAQTADILARHVDFFSIGTNDLTQYVVAADRGNPDAAYLYSTMHPAVLRSIKNTVRCAHKQGIPVGICGEAAADELLIPLWIALGIDELSVSPSEVLRVRRCISLIDSQSAAALAREVMRRETAAEVGRILGNSEISR